MYTPFSLIIFCRNLKEKVVLNAIFVLDECVLYLFFGETVFCKIIFYFVNEFTLNKTQMSIAMPNTAATRVVAPFKLPHMCMPHIADLCLLIHFMCAIWAELSWYFFVLVKIDFGWCCLKFISPLQIPKIQILTALIRFAWEWNLSFITWKWGRKVCFIPNKFDTCYLSANLCMG